MMGNQLQSSYSEISTACSYWRKPWLQGKKLRKYGWEWINLRLELLIANHVLQPFAEVQKESGQTFEIRKNSFAFRSSVSLLLELDCSNVRGPSLSWLLSPAKTLQCTCMWAHCKCRDYSVLVVHRYTKWFWVDEMTAHHFPKTLLPT